MPEIAKNLAILVGVTPWLELARTAAPVVTAWIALRALRNWQRQDRAKRETDFLDELLDATHQYILKMHGAIELWRMAKIGMASRINSHEENPKFEEVIAGAIAYIDLKRDFPQKRLIEEVNEIENSVAKLKSLAVKGQIFKFESYSKCFENIVTITEYYNRLVAFTSMINSQSWNWENQNERELLAKVIKTEPDTVLRELGECNSKIVGFVGDAYERNFK